eukprot:gnl/TRDRNA2_/TRDRNA2_155500_c1_seq1.p1 gnl/TRDRNA2_/TRDRNA2_155500_c1~~gnl/TRDRNA2_/TRDRNA2_155500_c1_seq1.p1  ORF type:complete len:118 (-),score=21.17 gnl/TRDRNA2_/TRDRNA2_155500_c1_seq1:219-572(-)
MVAAAEIGEGRRACPELLGDVVMPRVYPATNPMRDFGPTQGASGSGRMRSQSDLHEQLLQRFHKRSQQKKLKALDDEVTKKATEVEQQMRELERLRNEKMRLQEPHGPYPSPTSPPR